MDDLQYLLSLPPAMAREFSTLERKQPPEWFAACDPAGCKLGSGGGIAHLLVEAWRETGGVAAFPDWLNSSRKLLLLAGGQSRRLPAYAAVSKILMPFKALRTAAGQRLDQTLMDAQLPAYERVLAHAPPGLRALVTSGDVFLRFGSELPPFPEVDVLGLGMWVKPEVAQDFGVFFTAHGDPGRLAYFLQKPPARKIQELAASYHYLVDTGMWLLSEKAVATLLRRCGWDGTAFAGGVPDFHELYADFGLGLGSKPARADEEIGALTSAVAQLPAAEFYHLGTSRQLIEATSALENREHAQGGSGGVLPHPDQHVQNCAIGVPLRRPENHTLWVENATIPATWTLAHEHVLTNVPPNDWTLQLEPGVCLDFAPMGGERWCLRPYGFDDAFKGAIGAPETSWLGRPAADWFTRRGIEMEDAACDVQQAALFPEVETEALTGEFIEWMTAAAPADRPDFRERWMSARRHSAQEICEQCDLPRLYAQRRHNLKRALSKMMANHRWNIFYQLDLQATASLYAQLDEAETLPETRDLAPLEEMHDQMFRAAVLRQRGAEGWEGHELRAFQKLQQLVVDETRREGVTPRRCILDDQIIWGRSPVRLDLAGGWSDTPPYCIEYGGKVVNLAVNLNGQPPVQVFARLSEQPGIVLRSIDLGLERRIQTYEEIADYGRPDGAFSLAKAAVALAGFLPEFHAGGGCGSLEEQLREFGGGIEISLLAAAPKGSGLGTSSILAATLLGVLGELCGLGWDERVLFARALALEQMLTTGGGWQDQAGGLHRGVKLIETSPGIGQKPTLRWLPEHLFNSAASRGRVLLYYTGITRLAKNILQEIVRGMFLNSRRHLEIVDEIKAHAEATFHAIQTSSWEALCEAVRRSWELNKRLDSGTNPPAVEAILASVREEVAAAKLLGAGGGGYLMIFARDDAAALRIREKLTRHPPNEKARFVEFAISDVGLQITRS